jgi:3-hydroxyisobutyrate dehydrogenase-like beta-hydroxyacid dehydrogenase
MQPKIAFLGLGIQGSAIAGRFLEQGIALTVWNRTPEKIAPLEKLGATRAASPQEAAAGADIVITSVLDGPALSALALGPAGIAQSLGRGKIHCDMSTVDVATSRRMAEHYAGIGREFISAPVVGNPIAAAAGKLLIFAGGSAAAIDACASFFPAISVRVWRFDEPPRAIATKLCCNLLLASMTEALSEVMLLAGRSGVDQKSLVEIIMSSAMGAPLLQAKGDMITSKDYQPTFYMRNLLKDVNLALDAAATAGVSLPCAKSMREVYTAAVKNEFSELDFAAVYEWLAQQGTASSASA